MEEKNYKKLISEAFDAYIYAKEKGIDQKNPKTWDSWYKRRMKTLAGLVSLPPKKK